MLNSNSFPWQSLPRDPLSVILLKSVTFCSIFLLVIPFVHLIKDWLSKFSITGFSSVQSLSRVQLFATPWIAARQASLSITNSWSLPKPMSIKSVMPSSHLILCHPLLLLPPILPSIRVQLDYNLSNKVLKVVFTTLSLPGLCMADVFSKVLIGLSRNNIKRCGICLVKSVYLGLHLSCRMRGTNCILCNSIG